MRIPEGSFDASHDDEAQLRQELVDAFTSLKPTQAAKIAERLGLPDEEFLSLAMRNSVVFDTFDLFDKLGKEREQAIIATPEVQSAAKDLAIRELGALRISSLKLVIQRFGISPDVLRDPELQDAAKASVIENLRLGSHVGVFYIIEQFGVPEDFLASDEAVEAAMEGVDFLLSRQTRPQEQADNFVAKFAEKGLGHLVYIKRSSDT